MSTEIFLNGLLVAIITGVMLIIPSCAFKFVDARGKMEAEAVKAGAAEFYLDANHVRRFRWTPAAAEKAKTP